MMVDLQNLKNAISTGPFSEDIKQGALAIIDAAIARGGEITAEEKQKLLNMIDLDIDRNNLDQSANEEIVEMLDSFMAEIDSAAETAIENIEDAGESLEEAPQTTAPAPAEQPQTQAETQPAATTPTPPAEAPQQ